MFRERDRSSDLRRVDDWILVIQKLHLSNGVRQRNKTWPGEIFTIFIEDLLDSLTQGSLHKMFSKFGVIVDAFIPRKKSKEGKRFGFVPYNCSVAMDVAIQKTNGLRIHDKALKVKKVTYAKNLDGCMVGSRRRKDGRTGRDIKKVWYLGAQSQHWVRKNMPLKVVKRGSTLGKESLTVRVHSIGNRWLYHSVVATFGDYRAPDHLLEHFMQQSESDILIWRMGNNHALLTFSTKEKMKLFIDNHHNSGSHWFSSICPWSVDLNSGFHYNKTGQ
ncbi:hypothetical protein Dimus_020740 [Dionaea muscipula]